MGYFNRPRKIITIGVFGKQIMWVSQYTGEVCDLGDYGTLFRMIGDLRHSI